MAVKNLTKASEIEVSVNIDKDVLFMDVEELTKQIDIIKTNYSKLVSAFNNCNQILTDVEKYTSGTTKQALKKVAKQCANQATNTKQKSNSLLQAFNSDKSDFEKTILNEQISSLNEALKKLTDSSNEANNVDVN